MKDVFAMAGEVAAHSLWSVEDGEMLIPILGSLKRDGESFKTRLAMSSDDALEIGNEHLNNNPEDAKGLVLAWDGYITVDDEKKDCLLFDVRGYVESKAKLSLAIPYRSAHSSEGFGVYKPTVVKAENLSESEIAECLSSFVEGFRSHSEGARFLRLIDGRNEDAGRFGLTAEEWDFMVSAPVAVFVAVAAADGKVDKKEVSKFGGILGTAGKLGVPVLDEVFADCAGRVVELLASVMLSGGNVTDRLTSVSELVDAKLSAEDADVYKKTLFVIGKTIAESSGGFFGFGSKISKEEKAALQDIAKSLNLLA